MSTAHAQHTFGWATLPSRPADPPENRQIVSKATIWGFAGATKCDEGEVAAAVPGQIGGVPGQS